MRARLTLFFSLILASMLAVTVWASLDRSVFDVGPELLGDRWFQATLVDAYCGFLVVYAWVAYKETSWPARLGWLAGFLLLGNIAVSIYLLLQLRGIGPNGQISDLLLRRDRTTAVAG